MDYFQCFSNYATFRTNDQKKVDKPGGLMPSFVAFQWIYLPSGHKRALINQRNILRGTKDAHKLDIEHFLQGKELTQLTGNRRPEAVLKEMSQAFVAEPSFF